MVVCEVVGRALRGRLHKLAPRTPRPTGPPPLYKVEFEGVCFNSHHLGPRRAWKGGSEQQLMTPDWRDPVHPLDLVDPGDELQIVQICLFLLHFVTRVTLWRYFC